MKGEQLTIFDAVEETNTRRVLVDDEIFCPDCLVVASNRDDCPLCGTREIERAGSVIGNLPGGAHAPRQPWGRSC